MEIGQQQIGGAKPVAGGDEDVGVAGKGPDHAIGIGGAFQGAQRCGANRRDPPARAMNGIQPRRGLRHPVARVSACMRCWLVSSAVTGRKVPSPTCRVTASRVTPLCARRGEQLRREVQARRGRRHRAVLARKNGLVIGDILRIGLALAGDIGRQRHLAERRDGGIQRRARQGKAQLRLAIVAARSPLAPAGRRRPACRRPPACAPAAPAPNSGSPTGGDAAEFRSWRGRLRATAARKAGPGSLWCR